ncbi:MAG: TIR domain-containing protein [Pyrinomonadaceae bacterium]
MTEESATLQQTKPDYEWDFFLIHAGEDSEAAKNLYAELNPTAKVFLDDKDRLAGSRWNSKLSKAQRSSLISLALVTPNTENAHYAIEEIAIAIEMSSSYPYTHRVIPIYLNEKKPPKYPLYGLKSFDSICVPSHDSFTEAKESLLEALKDTKKLETKKVQIVAQHKGAVAKITSSESSKAEFFAGLVQATTYKHSILYTLIGLFVLILVLLIVALILIPTLLVQVVLGSLFGAFDAAILFSILQIISRSLGDAGQIAQGRIYGG